MKITTIMKVGILLKLKSQNSAYIVSFDTFAIQPFIKENKMMSRVIERNQVLFLPRKPFHTISKSCTYYGKSFKTAINSSKYILHKRHKLPFIIAHDHGLPLIFLPTMSPTSEHNIWIALHAIENFKGDNMGCTIYLANDYSIDVNVSEGTIQRQYALGQLLKINFLKKQRQLLGSTSFINN